MTSPDDFHNLEQQVTRALRAHGDSVEPSPDAYARLVRAVEDAPHRVPADPGSALAASRG